MESTNTVAHGGFGPQLYIDRLRAECWRALQAGHVDPAFRLYLQQFALLADASEVLALAAVVAPSFEESP